MATLAGRILALAIGAAAALAAPARAQDDDAGSALPRWVSLKKNEVFMREGPSYGHRVKWVYHRRGLPVRVIAEYDVWRRVADMDGDVGWIHRSMLTSQRSVLVTGMGQAVLSDASGDGIVAYVEPGVVADLGTCDALRCEITAAGTTGWIARARLWGADDGDAAN